MLMVGLAPDLSFRLDSTNPLRRFSMLRRVSTAVSFMISPVSGFFLPWDTQSTCKQKVVLAGAAAKGAEQSTFDPNFEGSNTAATDTG